MPARKEWIAGLAAAAIWTPVLQAQPPSPTVPPAVVPPSAAAAPAAASGAAQPTTLCSFIGLGPALANCKTKLCASQFGQMLNSMTGGPMAAVSGGFIPQLCPPPTAAQAAALAAAKPGSAAAAAAAIQASEADAKARVAAIEYLGTVDCSRWPEAQKALINGLRRDPNECVRFAAARALNSGCCCNKEVIEALRLTVSGETTDGAAVETSPRVKASAFSALQNCLMKVPEDLPPEVGPKPVGPERTTPNITPLPGGPERTSGNDPANPHIATAYTPTPRRTRTYEERLQHKTFTRTVEEARRTLFDAAQSPRQIVTIPTGKRSLFGVLAKSRQDQNAANIRRAGEQGQLPPMPAQAQVPVDPGVAPSSYSPIAAPGPATNQSDPLSRPDPAGSIDEPGPMSNSAPASSGNRTSPGRRGLIGLLFQPRNP